MKEKKNKWYSVKREKRKRKKCLISIQYKERNERKKYLNGIQRLRRKIQTNKRVKGIPEMKPLKRLQGRRKMPRSCSQGRKERRPRALPARASSRKLPTGRTVSSFVLLQLNEGPLCNSGRETPPKLVQLLDMALPRLFALSRGRAGGREA